MHCTKFTIFSQIFKTLQDLLDLKSKDFLKCRFEQSVYKDFSEDSLKSVVPAECYINEVHCNAKYEKQSFSDSDTADSGFQNSDGRIRYENFDFSTVKSLDNERRVIKEKTPSTLFCKCAVMNMKQNNLSSNSNEHISKLNADVNMEVMKSTDPLTLEVIQVV